MEAFNEEGVSVVGEQAELVITEPMPSMPIGFWGDPEESRLRAAYFERFPGVWCHGGWITITQHGTAIITGHPTPRSTAMEFEWALRSSTPHSRI